MSIGFNQLLWQRFIWGTLSGCVATSLIAGSPVLQNMQLSMLSWHYRIADKFPQWCEEGRRKTISLSKEISLVDFDDNSQFDLGIARFNDIHSQNILAEAVEAIEKCNPVLVVLDLDLRGAVSSKLLTVLRRYHNNVIALFGSLEASTDLPNQDYLSHAAALGYSEFPSEDGLLLYQLPINYLSAPTVLNPLHSNIATVPSLTEAIIDLNRRIRGVGPDMQFLGHKVDQPLYFGYRKQSYPEVSFQNVLNGHYEPEQFKDRIVMLGYTVTLRGADELSNGLQARAPALNSVKNTARQISPDMFIHANAVSTLLDHEQITALSPISAKLLVFLVGALFAGLAAVLKPWPRTIVYLTLNIALLLGGQFCFQLLHQLVPIVPPLVVLAVAYCLGTFIYLDANLRESNRELARARKSMQLRSEQERQRIAEDLHDETLPALSQVARLADKLNIELVDNPIPKEMRQSLDFSVAEMRRVINDLHPSVLETMGFKPALENLLAMLGQESKIQTHFSEEGDFTERELDKFQRLQLYRIVQEALNNVRKHSEATKAQVSIVKRSDKLILAIIDNGKGMQISKTSGQSHGILNIKQRAQLIGAKVAWLEARGYNSGTEVRIELILGSKDNIG